jgi:hypothetical protein
MDTEHPVLIVHTAPWCTACAKLLDPSAFNQIVKTIKDTNPSTEIKIIKHNNYNDTNKHDQYPTFNYINGFPTFMITGSGNCNRKGSFDKVRIFGSKYDKGKILGDNSSKVSFTNWLVTHLDTKLYSNKKANVQETDHDNVKKIMDTIVVSKPTHSSENKRTQRTFRLISVNNDV